MKKYVIVSLSALLMAGILFAQKQVEVPGSVKAAFAKKFPEAKPVAWEKEHGNYEANWGGKSGEDHSALFNPKGNIIEIVDAIAIKDLPKPVVPYIKSHYKGARITEAGRVTDAHNKISYEAEVNRKDIMFDEKGNFVKEEQ